MRSYRSSLIRLVNKNKYTMSIALGDLMNEGI